MRHFNDGTLKRKHYEDWADHGRQTFANDSDCESNQNFMVMGMATVHGSQAFQTKEGGIKESNNTQEAQKQQNKGHSIGYYQVSNGSEYNGKKIPNYQI